MKTIIFADIDGVFHHVGAGQIEYEGNEWRVVGEDLFRWAPALWELIAPHDVGIVIHSTWRYSHTLAELRERFPEAMRGRVLGVTEGGGRYESIMQYVEAHGLDRFLVLDDMPNEFPPDWAHLVACESSQGIADGQVQARIREF